MPEEQAAGRRYDFLKAAWPGLASWTILIGIFTSEAVGKVFLPLAYFILGSALLTVVWGIWWLVVAVQRRSITAGLGAAVTLSYPLLLSLAQIEPQGGPPPG